MMSSKILYTSGCSFSTEDWVIADNRYMEGYETGPHPMWPDILAKRLNLTPINTACAGMGNDYILATSMRYILDNHENIELVAIQWSQITRMWIYDIPIYGFFNPSVWLDEEDRKNDQWGPDFVGFPYIFGDPWKASQKVMNYVLLHPQNMMWMFNRWLREIYTLQKLCEKLEVNYIFAQGFEPHQLDPWRDHNPDLDWERTLKLFIDHPDFDRINEKKFMGWPCIAELGGSTLTDGHPDFKPWPKNRMNPRDPHPNANGQRLLADQYYKKYQELYK
jgi:hypothetical protein